jgi:hypothetical protein
MRVQIRTVLGLRSRTPGVLAFADGTRVRWSPRYDWECDCMFPGDPTCQHITSVRSLLDPAVYSAAASGTRP